MKAIPALLMLINANVDFFSEAEINHLIKVLHRELADRKADKEESTDE